MKHIEVVLVPVSDQQKSKDFYVKAGFQLITEAPMNEGENWVQLGFTGQATSISLSLKKTGKPADGKSFHQGVMLLVDDIEKEVNELEAKGIECKKIDDTPWGRFSWFVDPDGNEVSLHENKK